MEKPTSIESTSNQKQKKRKEAKFFERVTTAR